MTITAPGPTAPEKPTMQRRFGPAARLLRDYGLVLVVALLIGVCTISFGDRFFNSSNFGVIGQNAALVGTLGLAVTVVLVLWDFDLSVGAIATLSAILLAQHADLALLVLLLLAVAIGAACGAVNGLLVAGAGFPAFVSTLALGAVISGVATHQLSTGYIFLEPSDSPYAWATNEFAGMPQEFWAFLVVAIVVAVFLRQTRVGRGMWAVGEDTELARFRGIAVRRYRIIAYMLTGAIAGVFGLLLLSHVSNAAAGQGQTYLLDAYAVALIGATVGRFARVNVFGTVVAALFLSILTNALTLASWEPAVIQLVEALALIAGLLMVRVSRGLRRGGVDVA